MATLESLEQQIAEIKSILSGPVLNNDSEPWKNREMILSEVQVMERVINNDGSRWWKDTNGVPQQMEYGYISKEKDPVLWSKMVQVCGGDESRLIDMLRPGGRLARYKAHPMAAVMHYPQAFAFNLLSYILSNPLPPTRPGVLPEVPGA